ncbi:hypothetical protein V8F20_010003 [Naviculisporaceae sp. PSN 640]
MSYQDGRNMDRPPPPGSVRTARERAAAGFLQDDDEPQMARPSMTGQIRIGRPQYPTGLQTRDGQIGVAISKPTPMPQWPLQGAGLSSGASGSEPYRPPAGRSQPPQRPPRPSRVPSILDGSKIQDPTPAFQYRPQSGRESSSVELSSVPETPSSLSRPSTLSSVASIPDFPIPGQIPPGPPRRSVNLGPPPSARRGASSFYSNASFVSPIPEESPRSRSHTSFASSAAIPESWGTDSPGPSPNYPDAYYDGTIVEEGSPDMYGEDDAEESRLVRSASIGKRAKPTLVSAVTPRVPDRGDYAQRPAPVPVQADAFRNGTGYVENSSSSSSTLPMAKGPAVSATLTDAILNAYSSASATGQSTPTDNQGTPSPQLPPGARQYSRLSAIRRPPRLDIDAVRKAEARGSMTSLPDLIRRATRLAASLEKGMRPASRFEDFSGSEDYRREKERSLDSDKHQSGLSDMLAAFPPPAQAQPTNTRRSFRDSIREQVQSWPLPLSLSRSGGGPPDAASNHVSSQSSSKPGRRCCGLPLWGFLVVLFVVVILIAAAVVIPVEFLVIRKQNAANEAQAALQQCQAQLTCANGGTNVVEDGLCSCLCTNGFTGFDCTVAGTTGCTTISLAGEGSPRDVTLGNAIPRLLEQAQTNFSIPLSSAEILAKLNAGNLSCVAENALVTFDGRAVRIDAANAVVTDIDGPLNVANVINGVVFTTVTVMAGASTTITLPWPAAPTQEPVGSQDGGGVGFTTSVTSRSFATTITVPRPTTSPSYPASDLPTSTRTTTTTMTMSSGEPLPTAVFAVTEEVLDFARVAVLFILQEETLKDAENAQITLQRFFSLSSPTVDAASNMTLGNSNSINLVDFRVSTGGTPIGGRPSSKLKPRAAALANSLRFGKRGDLFNPHSRNG